MSGESNADPRDLLDAYDYVRTNNLVTPMVREMARLYPAEFVRVVQVLKDEIVAKKLMGEDGLPQIEWAQLDPLIMVGRIIDTIKRVREITGLGLKEAKDLVDKRRNDMAKGTW